LEPLFFTKASMWRLRVCPFLPQVALWDMDQDI
jgi:hypothetical protein